MTFSHHELLEGPIPTVSEEEKSLAAKRLRRQGAECGVDVGELLAMLDLQGAA